MVVKKAAWLKVVQYVGSAVAAAAAVVPVLFLLLPGLQPAGPPQELGAEIREVSHEPGVTLAEYLKLSRMSGADYTPEQLETPGGVIRFSVAAHGFKGRKLPSRWGVYDHASRRRICDALQPGPEFTPEAPADRAAAAIWVPDLQHEGDYYVRLELWDDRGVQLSSKDSEPLNFTR